jgi:hypothetical protein
MSTQFEKTIKAVRFGKRIGSVLLMCAVAQYTFQLCIALIMIQKNWTYQLTNVLVNSFPFGVTLILLYYFSQVVEPLFTLIEDNYIVPERLKQQKKEVLEEKRIQKSIEREAKKKIKRDKTE